MTSNKGLGQTQERPVRKAGTPNPLTAAAKMEHAIVSKTLLDIIEPRLTPEVTYPGVCLLLNNLDSLLVSYALKLPNINRLLVCRLYI